MKPTPKLQVFTVTVDGEKHEIEARNGWAAVCKSILFESEDQLQAFADLYIAEGRSRYDNEIYPEVNRITTEIICATARINELEAKVAMQAEALESICGDRCNAEYNPCEARTVLNTTQVDVEAYRNKIKAEALREAERYAPNDSCEQYCRMRAIELEGEK